MRISDISYLQSLLGKKIIMLASQVSGGISPLGAPFVGAHVLCVPRSDFSVGRAYEGDFVEITTDWHQTALGDDFHLMTIQAVQRPSDAGENPVTPHSDQAPFDAYTGFRADYFGEPVTRIEVFESEVRNETPDRSDVELIVYDSHIRFVSGDNAVVLTTEHGTILGEIEIYAGRMENFPGARGFTTARLRTVFSL